MGTYIKSSWIGLFFRRIDWVLFLTAITISAAGLITMNSFSGENYFFGRQLMWLLVSVLVFFGLSFVLRR